MKVRITRLYFDGLRRHREGSVISISDKKYTKASEIPSTSKKMVGDYVEFAPSCMEIVDKTTPLVDVERPKKITAPINTPPAAPPPIAPEATGEQVSAGSDRPSDLKAI